MSGTLTNETAASASPLILDEPTSCPPPDRTGCFASASCPGELDYVDEGSYNCNKESCACGTTQVCDEYGPVEETKTLAEIRVILESSDDETYNIVTRMRALFDARHHDNPEAIEVLASGLHHHSVLLRHEIAYVMGQMTQPSALPILISLLDNKNEHAMVRHEAGEGIAALGLTCPEAFEALKRHICDPNAAVRETCELAMEGLRRTKQKEERLGMRREKSKVAPQFYIFTSQGYRNPEVEEDTRIQKLDLNEYFGTCDPAEGDPKSEKEECVPKLRELLLDESKPLWDRYVAMFTLRNIKSEKAALALADSLDEKSSALLRHEVCFVLGQMQTAVTVDKLIERLADVEEHCMVRHEAALSLGSVGADVWSALGREARKKAIVALQKWSKDPEPIVWESCLTGVENILVETGSLDLDATGYGPRPDKE